MQIIIVAFGMIVFDFITGILKAFMTKSFNSSIMREGLINKAILIILIGTAVLLDYCQSFANLGVTIPLTFSTCVYIIIMELGSMIENVGKINDKAVPPTLRKFFEKLSDKENG